MIKGRFGRHGFLFLFLCVSLCGLAFIVACSNNQDSTPTTVHTQVTSGKSRQTFNLFGPYDFIFQCVEDGRQRHADPSGDKSLPWQAYEVAIGEDVQFFTETFTLFAQNGYAEDGGGALGHVRIFLDEELIADENSFVGKSAVVEMLSVSEASVLRVEIAGQCENRLGIRIEGAVADEVDIIGPNGGAVEIDFLENPLFGSSIAFPEGALPDSAMVVVELCATPPSVEDPFFSLFGEAIEISISNSGNSGTLLAPVQITLPLGDWEVGDPSLPIAAFFNETSGEWDLIPLDTFSTEQGFVSFSTDHFSIFSILSITFGSEIMGYLLQENEGTTLLQECLDLVNAGATCSSIADLRAQFSFVEDAAYEDLFEMSQTMMWCEISWLCGGHALQEWIVNKLKLTLAKTIIFGHTAFANVVGGVMAIAGTPCLVCLLDDTTVDPQFWVRLSTLIAAKTGTEICERWLDSNCNDPEPPAGFVLIPPGAFQMGSPTNEPGRLAGRETLHTVTLTQGFYMSRTEVTEEWWDAVMGSGSSTSQHPKAYVSWDQAVAFCNQLSLDEGLTPAYTINGPNGDATWNQAANGYRLPTEAEWEYACRGGSQAAFCNGPITYTGTTPLDPNLDQVGWYGGNAGGASHDVGLKTANAWGLHDMHGNLWERVWDGLREDYQNLPSEDPVYDVGPGANRVFRGGGWYSQARGCRSANRDSNSPNSSGHDVGFRPVRSAF